jgi:hypothetical protein
MPEPPRRFPAPTSTRFPGGYVIRDANGQALACVYSRENEAEARQAKVLTSDEARRIAVNIARLPESGRRLSVSNRVGHARVAPSGHKGAGLQQPAPSDVSRTELTCTVSINARVASSPANSSSLSIGKPRIAE